jgi:DNA-binding CsgD family transcriptional regulator
VSGLAPDTGDDERSMLIIAELGTSERERCALVRCQRQTEPGAPTVPEGIEMRLRKPALVGRQEELTRLKGAMARAVGGHGETVFLLGEPGVGKSRLAQEAIDAARLEGVCILQGRAYPLERSLAYGPLVDAFGSHLRRLDRRHLAPMVAGLPHLGRLIGDLPLPESEHLGSPGLEKARMFEAVARLCERMARESPVLLFLDDLQWADPASLELLHYLARGIGAQRVLILAAYNPDEPAPSRHLETLVASLERNEVAQRVALSRLAPDEIATLAGAMLGAEPPPGLLAQLQDRTAGTPLFVELLLQAFVDAGQLATVDGVWVMRSGPAVSPPTSIQDLILRRVERLDASDRRVLETIAVAGDSISDPLLRATVGLDDTRLDEALDRLRAAGFTADEDAAREVTYQITHPMIGEVVDRSMAEPHRRRIHAALATAIEHDRPEALEELAPHYRGAGSLLDSDRALDVAIGAGERASALGAHEAAARHFGAALVIVREGRRGDLLPWLLERLGEAWERVGEGAAAISVWTEANAEYARSDTLDGVARVRRLLAMAEWDRGHFEVARSHLSAGLAALAGSEPSQELADLHHARLVVAGRLGGLAEFTAAAADLKDLATKLGSARAAIEADLASAFLDIGPGRYAAARDRLSGVLAAAEAAGELVLAQRAQNALASAAYAVGDHRTQRRHATASLDVGRRLGAPTLELYPRIQLIMADLRDGSWDDALSGSAAALALARRLDIPRQVAGALSVRAIVLTLRGDVREARGGLDEAVATYRGGEVSDRNIFNVTSLAEVMLALESGEAVRAVELATALVQSPSVALTGLQAQTLALLGEAQVAAANAVGALATAEEIAETGRIDNPLAAALAAWVEGLAHRALGDAEAASSALATAIGRFDALDLPFELAGARLEWAQTIREGQPAEAVAAAQSALSTFERLEVRRHGDRARALLRGLGVRQTSRARRRGKRGLSDRELEVARLVADGMTNRQIAERLVISPRTVSTHLDRMYARLGLASRAALARYVTEQGWGPGDERPTDERRPGRLRTGAAPITSVDG